MNGVDTDLASGPLAGDAPYLLEVTAFDDEVRARVGRSEVVAPRNAFRAGRMALVAQGPASFASLRVDGLDAYRFEFMTSSYDDFAGHVGNWEGKSASFSHLRQPRTPRPNFVMQTRASPNGLRHLRYRFAPTRRLEISSHASGMFLIESPEPLAADVSIRLFQNSAEKPSLTLADETASRMLIVCDAPLTGDIRLEFRLDRSRTGRCLPTARAISRRRLRSPSSSIEGNRRARGEARP